MERQPFFLSPFVDGKPRNVHVPPYPPLSPGVKQPISPIPRVPVTKPTPSYRNDDILCKPDPRPPASMPTAVHYRSYPSGVPPLRYGYGPNVSYRRSSMLQSQWRDRFNVKRGTPSDDILEELANDIDPECWKKLGRRLKVEKPKLTAIHKENEEYCEKAYEMLLHWKQMNASAATFEILFDALTHKLVHRKDLAVKYCCEKKK